jgi:hypothetical protein
MSLNGDSALTAVIFGRLSTIFQTLVRCRWWVGLLLTAK